MQNIFSVNKYQGKRRNTKFNSYLSTFFYINATIVFLECLHLTYSLSDGIEAFRPKVAIILLKILLKYFSIISAKKFHAN